MAKSLFTGGRDAGFDMDSSSCPEGPPGESGRSPVRRRSRACRVPVVLSARGEREVLLERGRPVADARARERYGPGRAGPRRRGGVRDRPRHARALLLVGGAPLDAAIQPAPSELGADGAKIEVEGWRPRGFVAWAHARPSLRRYLRLRRAPLESTVWSATATSVASSLTSAQSFRAALCTGVRSVRRGVSQPSSRA
jgi:hypothetical protein